MKPGNISQLLAAIMSGLLAALLTFVQMTYESAPIILKYLIYALSVSTLLLLILLPLSLHFQKIKNIPDNERITKLRRKNIKNLTKDEKKEIIEAFKNDRILIKNPYNSTINNLYEKQLIENHNPGFIVGDTLSYRIMPWVINYTNKHKNILKI